MEMRHYGSLHFTIIPIQHVHHQLFSLMKSLNVFIYGIDGPIQQLELRQKNCSFSHLVSFLFHIFHHRFTNLFVLTNIW